MTDQFHKSQLKSGKIMDQLTKVEANTFQHLNSLKILDLRLNKIDQIDLDGFKGLDNLEELNLEGP